RVGLWGNQVSGIGWVTEDVAYIAGDNIILKTIDGGLSWIEQEAPTDNLMLSLDFYDTEKGIIVGTKGVIYQTSGGGRSWESIDLGTSVQLKDVCIVTKSTIVNAGVIGDVYTCTNGGR